MTLPLVLGLTLSLIGVLKILLVVACLVLLVVGLKYLFGLMGWTLPPQLWGIIGIIVILLVLIWLLSGGVVNVG